MSEELPLNSSIFFNRFKQNLMPEFRINLSKRFVYHLYIITGIVFCSIGIWILICNDSIKEFHLTYNKCTNKICFIDFEINQDFKPPIFVYYELEKFYQNHKRFSVSINIKQLTGKVFSSEQIACCFPIILISDLSIVNRKCSQYKFT